MKLRLPLSLKAVLLVCLSLAASAGAATYLAEGVKLDSLTTSERFFDNGKGYYWTNWPVYSKVNDLFIAHNRDLSFLGDLTQRIDDTHNLDYYSTFNRLQDDGNTCWYNASCNVLQYWETYYGVFYKGTDPLPYGHNYSQSIAQDTGGTQSLRMELTFYDNWENAGGDFFMAANWYLSGSTEGIPSGGGWSRKIGDNPGGYFGDYFPDVDSSYYQGYVIEGWGSASLEWFTEDVLKAMGCEYSNNAITCVTPGHIMTLGIASDQGNGHALTCYGFTLDDNGLLKSFRVVNSDDSEYTTFELFVKEAANEHFYLYTDEGCSKLWDFVDPSWYVSDFSAVATSDQLKEMYAEYTDQDTPLTWNGERTTWSEQDTDTATLERLPVASDGWDVYAVDGYYRSYYHEGRPVLFNDHAASGTVGLDGALTAPKVTIDNSSKAYTFSGTEGTTLDTPELVKSGTNTATFTGVDITAAQVKVGTGKLLLGQNASLDINSQVVIKALGSESAAGMYSTNGNQTYSLGNSSITIENAVVDYIANTAGTLSNLLSNVKLVNNSTATLTENNSNNKSGISAHAAKGSIQFLNKGTEGITLKDAIIGTDLSLSVYKGTTVSEAEESALYIQGKLVGLTNSTINANLTMMVGSELDVSGTENAGINLGSALTFNLGMKLSEADVNAVLGMNEGGAYHLFNSVDSITLASSGYSNWTQAITVKDAVDASTYFTNLEQGKYFITYTGGENVGQVMLMGATVPEPATGTLSLLALAALAARRRRK